MSSMNEMVGQAGELRATVQVTRKATGKVEEYELVGRLSAEQHEQLMSELNKEQQNGTNRKRSFRRFSKNWFWYVSPSHTNSF